MTSFQEELQRRSKSSQPRLAFSRSKAKEMAEEMYKNIRISAIKTATEERYTSGEYGNRICLRFDLDQKEDLLFSANPARWSGHGMFEVNTESREAWLGKIRYDLSVILTSYGEEYVCYLEHLLKNDGIQIHLFFSINEEEYPIGGPILSSPHQIGYGVRIRKKGKQGGRKQVKYVLAAEIIVNF